jgi:G3E family GTPase
MTDRLPVALITGFLGSGKTTLISALLAHPAMGETAVLVNELGEVAIDHHLVRRVDERTVVLGASSSRRPASPTRRPSSRRS